MKQIESQHFPSFINAKRAAAVHFDAEWNESYRTLLRRRMRDAESSLGTEANFGEVDRDASPELARSIPILNVPSMAYYAEGKLIAVLAGAEQDVRRLVRLGLLIVPGK
jgi:thioredoxin-like negative regulator of GroEL